MRPGKERPHAHVRGARQERSFGGTDGRASRDVRTPEKAAVIDRANVRDTKPVVGVADRLMMGTVIEPRPERTAPGQRQTAPGSAGAGGLAGVPVQGTGRCTGVAEPTDTDAASGLGQSLLALR